MFRKLDLLAPGRGRDIEGFWLDRVNSELVLQIAIDYVCLENIVVQKKLFIKEFIKLNIFCLNVILIIKKRIKRVCYKMPAPDLLRHTKGGVTKTILNDKLFWEIYFRTFRKIRKLQT